MLSATKKRPGRLHRTASIKRRGINELEIDVARGEADQAGQLDLGICDPLGFTSAQFREERCGDQAASARERRGAAEPG